MGIYRTHLYLLRFFHPFNPYNPCSFHHWVFCRTRIYRIDADASLGERVSQLYKIRYILIIRVRFTAEFFFEHGFIGLTRIKYQYIKIQKYIFLCFFLIFIYWCFINVVLSSRQPFLLLVIIPRLRPGLLSLRSVLSSRQLSFCALSPSALSPCSKSITNNPNATDLFFHGFLLCCWISLRLACAMIVTDYLLLSCWAFSL